MPDSTPEGDGAAPTAQAAAGNYAEYTAATSSVVRSLGVAAVATVWLFGGGLAGQDAAAQDVLGRVGERPALAAALVLSVAALSLDLLQYAWASATWGALSWSLGQILVSDDPDAGLDPAVRRAWAVARAFGYAGRLEHRLLDGAAPTAEQSRAKWDARLAALRGSVATARARGLLDEPYSPPWLNLVTSVLFFAKTAALACAYACLLVGVV